MSKTLNGYKLIAYYLGIFIMMIGMIVLVPLILLIFYKEEASLAYCFLIPGFAAILFGFIIFLIFRKTEKRNLEHSQDTILVVNVWIIAILVSCLPFVCYGYSFTQSIFEMTSGYSTTGLSIIKDVEVTPHLFLFFRSLTQFIGGVGLVLILTCAISDKYGFRIYTAEGHSDKLLPNLAKSARLIFIIYFAYIVLGIIAYVISGMPIFDAVNHAMCAVATGGFSVKNASILAYNSVAIEIITDILMILGSTSFVLHLALIRFKFKDLWHDCEVRFFLGYILLILPLTALVLFLSNYSNDFWYDLRVSSFQMISCLTTTGFFSVPYFNPSTMAKLLPPAFFGFMIISMVIGGGLGSTSGAIKQFRVVAAVKGIYYEIKDRLSNRKVIKTHFIARYGQDVEMTNNFVDSNIKFVLVYILILIVGSLAISCFGYELGDSLFEMSSALGTVGLSVGVVGGSTPYGVLWILIGAMFLGRLEIYIVFQALIRIFNDIARRQTM